jgi:sensor histidine kinase regulating citrate/malate metabolism
MIAVHLNNNPARRALTSARQSRPRSSAPARRRTRPHFGRAAVVLAAIGALALAYVGETAMATQSSYQIGGLKAQQAQLLAQQQQIRYQISLQTSAGRLDGQAGAMGMVRASNWQYVQGGDSRLALLHTEPDAAGKQPRSLLDEVAAALGQPTVAEAHGR